MYSLTFWVKPYHCTFPCNPRPSVKMCTQTKHNNSTLWLLYSLLRGEILYLVKFELSVWKMNSKGLLEFLRIVKRQMFTLSSSGDILSKFRIWGGPKCIETVLFNLTIKIYSGQQNYWTHWISLIGPYSKQVMRYWAVTKCIKLLQISCCSNIYKLN